LVASAFAGVVVFGVVQKNARSIDPKLVETQVVSADQALDPTRRDFIREAAVASTEPANQSKSVARIAAAELGLSARFSLKPNGDGVLVRRMSPGASRVSTTSRRLGPRAEGIGSSDLVVVARRPESLVLRPDADRRATVAAGVLETAEPRSNPQRVSLGEAPGVSMPALSEATRVGSAASPSLSNALVATIEDDSDRVSYQDELTAQSEASRRVSSGGAVVSPDVNRVAVVQAPVTTGKR